MKTKLLTLIVLFCGLFVVGQTKISGQITDPSGMAIPGVNVVVKGTSDGGITDLDGNFSFVSNQVGAQKIQASYVGFEMYEETKTFDGSEIKLAIQMKASSEQLNEVVLTATSTRRSQKETPLSITSFGQKELAQKNTGSQADILRSVPGITAEGGGGEVGANVFVRGLPSGGQYQFNPIQIDGMPVLGTFGLNSSAHDVYFRNDLGMRSLEFVRGGSSILYGVGSVAGIINYTSVTGSAQPKTTLRIETATNSRYKADFVTSGPLGGEDSDLFYSFSGFYRYDEGPIKTGLTTRGFQLRGNIKKKFENGSFTLSGQTIDDKVQFFLPLPLEGGTRARPTGNDGETIYTLQTAAASDFSYQTPDGMYHSPIDDGVKTKGGYFLANYIYNFEDDLKFDAKLRYSKYQHEFNLFLDGSGLADANVVETQAEYLAARNLSSGDFTYLNGEALDSDALLFENRVLDRDRPIQELMADIKLVKSLNAHTFTLGSFMTHSEADDVNFITSYLSEYRDRPDLINVSGYTVNGITNRGTSYSNRSVTSNKIAVYLADEIRLDKWNFDVGLRYERASGDIKIEGTKSYVVDNTGIENIDNVMWGNGSYTRGHVTADGLAVALAALYKIDESYSVYGNFSKGYFFPELRSISFDGFGNPASYKPENILQGEAGLKYGKGKLSGTVALYGVTLKDRRAVTFVNTDDGGATEQVDIQDSETYGAEVTWNWRFVKDFSFGGSVTYQDHQLTKSEGNPEFVGNELRRQPKLLGTLNLGYNNTKVDAAFGYNYTGEKYSNDANTILLDAFGLASLNMGYTFSMGENLESIRLGARVYNLFNSEGITEGSPRLADNQTEEAYFVGRPVLPTRLFLSATINF
ncbi:Outer membrane receptor proteins, mostly Fe transport [Mesonia phycicola]|uniref:Outer membrane receptor proteins, mostly Fe transport n=1 Tax=Mesonia phycicola TaxID=579105 RepID=A0A1M6FJH4_9FLAO|nr:TonB-dependent receptor [Mesonia phycicola]SHI97857.1 Outer membrane receptor proteins, mostly Fe transport [Mesonia phycicola]